MGINPKRFEVCLECRASPPNDVVAGYAYIGRITNYGGHLNVRTHWFLGKGTVCARCLRYKAMLKLNAPVVNDWLSN